MLTASVATVSESVDVAPSVAGSSGNFVAEASRNVSAQSQAPVIISNSKGGDTVNTSVQNNSTTIMGGGASARNTDFSFRQNQAADAAAFAGS